MHHFNRPLRVPKDVPLSVADPAVARAGERGRWRLLFELGERVEAGRPVGVQFYGGRFNRLVWPGLQGENPAAAGFVSCRVGDAILPLKPAQGDRGSFYFLAPREGIPAGARVEVFLGGERGTLAPEYALENKFFLLFLPESRSQPKTRGLRQEPARRVLSACLMRITGAEKHHLRVLAPSFLYPGEKARLLVRPEDRWGNPSCQAPGHLIVRLNGDEIKAERRDSANSACCWLENIDLPAEGVHRLEVEETGSGMCSTSNPIQCFASAPRWRPLWGMIHAHTELSDGLGSLDHYFRYMQEEVGLDFGAVSDHDHLAETPDAFWRIAQELTAHYNQPGRFVTFLGYEWAKWLRKGYGDRNVYYLHDHRPIYRSDEGHYPHPKDLFRALEQETALIIPHHSASNGNHCDWLDHDPDKERLVEIYSCWGCSERSVKQGNPFPIRPAKKLDNPPPDAGEVPAGFVQKALEMGWRVGFTGGGDDHYGHPGDEILIGWPPFRYKAGLMAVWASEKTRASIWEAMWRRRTYATTGARIILKFTLNDHEMGSILSLCDDPELTGERLIRVEVHATDAIDKIEIVRNNHDVYAWRGQALDVVFTWKDEEKLPTINLPPARWSAKPFTFYYVRVTQRDGEMAWASPIWIET
ncbi:MAG: DUF3604 domain-containing protein [Chloroflexi bacterium]|nr:DUF3604 domain-containing protein [Chloroflexota bacterium]